jgi:hypothetical protein
LQGLIQKKEMPIPINYIHDYIRGILKKNTSGFLSPEDIDRALNNACIDVLRDIIEDYKARVTVFSGDQSMLFFHSFSGEASERTLPSDVFEVANILIGDFEGDLLDYTEFNDRQQSVILPPSVTRPIGTIFNDGVAKIKILPSSTTHKIKYWKIPVLCKYAYTETTGIPFYNPTGSVNIEFPMTYYTRILTKALVYLSPSSKNQDSATLEQTLR